MDSRSRTLKFYILALHTIQLLASSPFGLCGNADRVTPGIGPHGTLSVLQQIESPSPENSFPYGIFTSPPPPPPSTTISPISPQNSPPFGTYIAPPPTPTRAMPPPPLLSTSLPPPPPSPSAQSPLHNAPKPPAAIIPPPNGHSLPLPPPAMIPPPNGHSSAQKPPPAAPNKKPESGVWCVAMPAVPADLIQQALDYACGSGAGCDAIQPNGVCYQPATLISHASYAFNSYWQKRKQGGGTCDFGGTAMLVTVDPSYNQCRFAYN